MMAFRVRSPAPTSGISWRSIGSGSVSRGLLVFILALWAVAASGPLVKTFALERLSVSTSEEAQSGPLGPTEPAADLDDDSDDSAALSEVPLAPLAVFERQLLEAPAQQAPWHHSEVPKRPPRTEG